MKSFTLLKTNPKLTTNVKIIYSDDKVYLESFEVLPELSERKFTKKILPQNSDINSQIGKFWQSTPKEIAYFNFDELDFDTSYNSYDKQIDDTYISGASRVTNYEEEFEYFAPVHIYKEDIPCNFIVFRADGAGVLDLNNVNFRQNVINKLKVVENFNLKSDNKLGKMITNTFVNNDNLPNSGISINFNQTEFTYWNGIDYETGEYTSKGKILDETLEKELTFTQGFDLLTSNFEDEGVIYPFILNLSFLFDDKPASPEGLNTWGINRYYGFYGDLEEVTHISAYTPPALKGGLKLDRNNIFTLNGERVNPFKREFKDDKTYYVEYDNIFYLVEAIDNGYKVISDITLPTDVDSNFNLNAVTFLDNNTIKYQNGNNFTLDEDSDVLVINIDGVCHRFLKDGDHWRILSDYRFEINNNIFKYFINRGDPSETTILNLNEVTKDSPPKGFKICKFNFKEVKNFDLDILDTEYSKFEYEFNSIVTKSEEPKLYEDDNLFSGYEKPIEKYIYNKEVTSVPAASEYLATSELFELIEKEQRPNKFWDKNTDIIKWGIESSVANNDYPYMFNINQKGDDYNRVANTENNIPSRMDRNLDYFYTMASSDFNFGYNANVIHQSLSIINDTDFEIDKYFNRNYETNYFDEIFSGQETYNDITSKRTKFSNFLPSEESNPNKTWFKGLEFSIYDVDQIEKDDNTILKMNVSSSNRFENYKFSVLLSAKTNDIENDFQTISRLSNWVLIKNWERNTTYFPGDIVQFDGTKFKNSEGQYGFPGYILGTSSAGTIEPSEYIYPNGESETLTIDSTTFDVTEITATGPNNGNVDLFLCTATTSVISPFGNPINSTDWASYPPTSYRSIYYRKDTSYLAFDPSITYNSLIDRPALNFNYLSYFVFYKGEFYKSVTEQGNIDNITPETVVISDINGSQIVYWEKIEQYNTTRNYTENEIVTLDRDLYYFDSDTEELSLIFTFKPSVDTLYRRYNIIRFNDDYYTNLVDNSVLDNGVNIYINKKWKNILINPYFNDIINPFNSNRELLYSPELQQLTASNMIEIINNINLKNGFIKNLTYYVIEEDGSFNSYDINNIEEIPHIIQVEGPTEKEIFSHSLIKRNLNINRDIFNIDNSLENNNIETLEQINYYNGQPLAYKFENRDGLTFEDRTSIIYRFGGEYNPIFNSIPLFESDGDNNYKFNENLRGFGEIREMIKSKVNENDILVNKEGYSSIYPQIDEIGFFVDRHNIFKSTWDKRYYKKTI